MWRRLFVLAALAALAAYFFRRRVPAAPFVEVSDPADELRRKLDETRAAALVDEDGGDSPVADLDARRREVHDRARAAVDEMRGPDVDSTDAD
jgi:hypothetical protein